MGEYFKEVEEESIRDNFVICYELLDELVDFGYPQTTDAKILQEYITQASSVGVTFPFSIFIKTIGRYITSISFYFHSFRCHRNELESTQRLPAKVWMNEQRSS